MSEARSNVRFTPQSGPIADVSIGPIRAKSGPSPRPLVRAPEIDTLFSRDGASPTRELRYSLKFMSQGPEGQLWKRILFGWKIRQEQCGERLRTRWRAITRSRSGNEPITSWWS